MQKLSNNKIKIIHRNGQSVSNPVAPKKGINLFSLLNFPRAESLGKSTATVLKEPVLKSPPLDIPQADLAAVKNWVALEEKIVHDYKEQKTVHLKSAVPLPKTPVKQVQPAFETFSTQTAVSSSSNDRKLKDPARGSERTFLALGRFLLVVGWLAAGAFMFLYSQETFVSREVGQKLSQLQNEKVQLEHSYAALKNVSEDQRVEIAWLNSQLQDTALELKTARSEIIALQGKVQTQDAVVNALKAQSQAFEKIIEGGMSAVSGAVAGLSKEQFSTSETSEPQGEVTSINGRQGFVVISMGAANGASSGRRITISRGDRELAVGRIDRVYPTMSVAVLRNAGISQMIQEGDSVSFS